MLEKIHPRKLGEACKHSRNFRKVETKATLSDGTLGTANRLYKRRNIYAKKQIHAWVPRRTSGLKGLTGC